jgi:hypothetical protein
MPFLLGSGRTEISIEITVTISYTFLSVSTQKFDITHYPLVQNFIIIVDDESIYCQSFSWDV